MKFTFYLLEMIILYVHNQQQQYNYQVYTQETYTRDIERHRQDNDLRVKTFSDFTFLEA